MGYIRAGRGIQVSSVRNVQASNDGIPGVVQTSPPGLPSRVLAPPLSSAVGGDAFYDFGSASLTAPALGATGDAAASFAPGSIATSSPTFSATAGAAASYALGSNTLSAPAFSAAAGALGTFAPGSIATSPPTFSATGDAATSYALGSDVLSPPIFFATGSGDALALFAFGSVTLFPPLFTARVLTMSSNPSLVLQRMLFPPSGRSTPIYFKGNPAKLESAATGTNPRVHAFGGTDDPQPAALVGSTLTVAVTGTSGSFSYTFQAGDFANPALPTSTEAANALNRAGLRSFGAMAFGAIDPPGGVSSTIMIVAFRPGADISLTIGGTAAGALILNMQAPVDGLPGAGFPIWLGLHPGAILFPGIDTHRAPPIG